MGSGEPGLGLAGLSLSISTAKFRNKSTFPRNGWKDSMKLCNTGNLRPHHHDIQYLYLPPWQLDNGGDTAISTNAPQMVTAAILFLIAPSKRLLAGSVPFIRFVHPSVQQAGSLGERGWGGRGHSRFECQRHNVYSLYWAVTKGRVATVQGVVSF